MVQSGQSKPDHIAALESHFNDAANIGDYIVSLNMINPTLFQLMNNYCGIYLYVTLPDAPGEDDASTIASALTKIGEEYLDIHTKNRSNEGRQVIQLYGRKLKYVKLLYAT
ncbi:hypothetical protein [Lentibacillus sp. CBA3610]|uniref:hypothetical protein n=1 Tax=Lentibacillus sp. CBA3610 TaxID=2518176 RepID=UPI001595CF43|nr:hypothetical protein [Lentibacillus sp. CBA3610]QKY69601.1 hypothetical protein Len3610_08310 [Lentibacillus sp. CBA3610]